LNSLDGFSKNRQIPNVKKIRPVGAYLLHEDLNRDRESDRHDEIFGNAPENSTFFPQNIFM